MIIDVLYLTQIRKRLRFCLSKLRQRSSYSRSQRSGFSLAELLVVIVIMSVLAAVSLPAFNSMMGGSALEASSSDVKAAIGQARQYAIMNNTPSHFVIASAANLPVEHQDKWMRAYCVYDTRKQVFVKDWRYLPEGLVFDNLDKNTPFIVKGSSGRTANILKSVATPSFSHQFDNGSGVTGNHWIKFHPTGTVDWESTSGASSYQAGVVAIGIAEGFTMPGTGTLKVYNELNLQYSAKMGIVVYRNSGRSVIKEVL